MSDPDVCATRVFGTLRSRKELTDAMAERKKLARQVADDTNDDFFELYNELIEDLVEELEEVARLKEVGLLASRRARARGESFIRDRLETFGRSGKGKIEPVEALNQFAESAANAAGAAAVRTSGTFFDTLRSENLLNYFRDRRNWLNLLKELKEINTVNGRPGVTGDPRAKRLAEIYQRTVNEQRAAFLDLGIPVNDLDGRILRQAFDVDSLQRRGKDYFINFMKNRVDRARTFEGRKVTDLEVERFLSEYYDGVTGGTIRDIPLDGRDLAYQRATYKTRTSRHRKLHLKTAEDTLDALTEYGNGRVDTTMAQTLVRTTTNAALLQAMGPNPRNTLEHIRQYAKNFGDSKQRENLENGLVAGWILDVLDGSAEQGGSQTWKNTVSALRSTTHAAFLSNITLASIGDFGVAMRASGRIGANGFQTISDIFKSFILQTSPEHRTAVLGAVDAVNAHMTGEILNIASGTSFSAKAANVSNSFANFMFTAGLSTYTTPRAKAATATAFVNLLARFSKLNWDEFEPAMRIALLKGGVSKEDWSFLTAHAETMVMKAPTYGRTIDLYIPTHVEKIPDEAIAKKLGQTLFKRVSAESIRVEKRRLANALDGAVKSFSDDSILTSGPKERAQMRMGVDSSKTSPIAQAVVSFSTTMMGFPWAYMTRAVGREIENGTPLTGIAHLTAAAMFFGTISTILIDLVKSQERDWFSDDPAVLANNFMEVLIRGGAGGLLGSVIIEAMRYGTSPTESLVGAPLGLVNRIASETIKVGQALSEGDVDKASARAVRELSRISGVTTLPYVRPIWDNLVLYPFLEMTDPEMLYDMERRLQQRQGGGLIYFK